MLKTVKFRHGTQFLTQFCPSEIWSLYSSEYEDKSLLRSDAVQSGISLQTFQKIMSSASSGRKIIYSHYGENRSSKISFHFYKSIRRHTHLRSCVHLILSKCTYVPKWVRNSVWYSERPGVKSRAEDRLSWLGFSWFTSVTPSNASRAPLIQSHSLPHLFQFIIH
jgi:hypothetical protein